MKKLLLVTYWAVLALLLFAYLQSGGKFHFLFMEQTRLFVNSPDTLLRALSLPSGFVSMVSDFLQQFFFLPCCGAAVMAVILVATGGTTFLALRKRLDSELVCAALATVPAVAGAFILFDSNISCAEPLACLALALALLWYYSLGAVKFKALRLSAAAALLFWLAGAAAVPFAVIVALEEICARPSNFASLIPAVLVGALTVICVRAQMFGEYRDLLLPDNFYNLRLHPTAQVYIAWFSLPAVFLLAFASRKTGLLKGKPVPATVFIALCIVGGAFAMGSKAEKPAFYHELDYYARNGRWEDLLKATRGRNERNHICSALKNMALAEMGQLGDRMFSFAQTGAEGLYLQWKPVPYISILLSDLYWSMGNIALAQKAAFEANVSYGNRNPRMIQRLIDTNLIYGQYEVAEKYISILEKTWRYRSWARGRRALLGDDDAVMADPLLSAKRKCIPDGDVLSGMYGENPTELALIAESNPAHKATIEYLGGIYLLASDLTDFMDMVDRYYGTDVMPTLPQSFQEAVLVYAEHFPGMEEKYGLSSDVLANYAAFRDFYHKNKNSPSLQSQLKARFGDTYWVYFLAN